MTGRLFICLVLAVLLGAGLWNASEMHYRSCVEAATARTIAPTVAKAPTVAELLAPADANAPTESRTKAVNGCSRMP